MLLPAGRQTSYPPAGTDPGGGLGGGGGGGGGVATPCSFAGAREIARKTNAVTH